MTLNLGSSCLTITNQVLGLQTCATVLRLHVAGAQTQDFTDARRVCHQLRYIPNPGKFAFVLYYLLITKILHLFIALLLSDFSQ